MSALRLTTCKSCAAPIRWATTDGGKKIPLDGDPIIGGNIALAGSTARVLSTEGQRLAAANQQPRYVSHFVTCAHAKDWRSK